jgi:broad specificity phosphatase PhoE
MADFDSSTATPVETQPTQQSFDPSTAQPVAQSQGFDPSTAKPVEQPQQPIAPPGQVQAQYVRQLASQPIPAEAQQAQAGFEQQHPILTAAANAIGQTVKGFVPTTPLQAAEFASPAVGAVETLAQTPRKLADVMFGGKTVAQAFPESQTLVEAEKTPAFSQERFQAGFGTLANLLFGAAISRGLAAPATEAIAARPTTEAGLEAEARQITGNVKVPNFNPYAKQPTTGEPNAIQPSNAQVETGKTTLGVEARPPGEVSSTSSSDNALRETQRAAARGEIPGTARQGTEAQPQEVKPPENVIFVRHGATAFNERPGGVAEEPSGGVTPQSPEFESKIRGHLDVPLDENGEAQARQLGQELQGKGITKIYTSDLSRASDTADAISQGLPEHPNVIPQYGLRPWSLGPEIEGKETASVVDKMNHYVDHPDEVPPGGESFNTFKNRFESTVDRLQKENEGEKIAIVTHYRGLKLLQSIKNGEFDPEAFKQSGGPNAIPPGSYWGQEGVKPEPGAQPEVAATTEKPPVQAATEPVGISQARTEAELGKGSVEPGAGAEMGSGIDYGRQYINKGGDPRLPIRRAETSGLVGKNEVGIVHAELERLRGERSAAATALEADPTNPELQQKFAQADDAQRSWRKELQPVLTKASDALREAYAQSVPDADPSTYQGLANIFDEHFKGQREITPEMRTAMSRAASGVKQARAIANTEMANVEQTLTKQMGGRKVMTPDELHADLQSVLRDQFKDCILA